MEIFWGSSQNWTIFRGHFKHFRGFSEGQCTEWGIFFWLQNFKYLSDVLEILDIFCGEQ